MQAPQRGRPSSQRLLANLQLVQASTDLCLNCATYWVALGGFMDDCWDFCGQRRGGLFVGTIFIVVNKPCDGGCFGAGVLLLTRNCWKFCGCGGLFDAAGVPEGVKAVTTIVFPLG